MKERALVSTFWAGFHAPIIGFIKNEYQEEEGRPYLYNNNTQVLLLLAIARYLFWLWNRFADCVLLLELQHSPKEENRTGPFFYYIIMRSAYLI